MSSARRLVLAVVGLALMALGAAATAHATTPTYTTNYVWDQNRRLVMTIAADPGTGIRPATKYTYDFDGELIETDKGTTTSATGSDFTAQETTTYAYDAVGNKTLATVRNGVSTSVPALAITQASYDADDRPLCTAVRMSPELYGSLPASACALATGSNGYDRITLLTYDAAGQKLVETRALGTPIQEAYATYAYGQNGEQTSIADANNNLTSLTYDGFIRLSQMTFPSPTTHGQINAADYEAYAYDANNNRLSVRKRDGQVISFTYDALNREILKHWPTGGGANDVYAGYDLLNRRLYANYASATGQGVAYSYDVTGRLLTETSPQGQLGYQYDQANNRTRVTWPDSFYATYTYDALNRMTLIQDSAGGSPGTYISYTYDSLGRRNGIARGNSTSTALAYDGADRLTSFCQALGGTNCTTPAAPGVTFGFSYIPSSQITARAISNDAYTWAANPATISYAVNGLNQYTTVSGASFTYDARGDLTSDGTRTFTYDVENRLLTDSVGGSSVLALSYDPLGRLQQTISASATTQFLYAGDQLVAEYAGSTLLRRYIHGAATDEPVIWYELTSGSPVRNWLHEDNQGSVIAATSDTTGTATATYTYGAYGEPNAWSGSRFRYTGQIMLPEAQLYHYKARVYDPTLGRFLQTDPVGYKSDLDLYAYVGDEPVDRMDPTGLYLCFGSNGDCGRFANDLTTLRNAANDPQTSQKERKAINDVLGAYGPAHANNGVTVEFGSLSQGEGGQTADSGKGQITVTIDYKQVDAAISANRSKSPAKETASVVGHEGQHAFDAQHRTFAGDIENCGGVACVTPDHYKNEETSAYTTQFLINNALHNNSKIGPNSLPAAQSMGEGEGAAECQASPTCQ